MRWNPPRGHVPRGFCGALGRLGDVQLVLIVAEPGDPHEGESCSADSPEEFLEATCRYTYGCFATGKDQFHRNIRERILDKCWSKAFAEQMRRTWITESVLCSARKECGPVSAPVVKCCVNSYLEPQLAALPPLAVIATLGAKAEKRTAHLEWALGREFIHAGAAAPPGCNFKGVKESWDRIVNECAGGSPMLPKFRLVPQVCIGVLDSSLGQGSHGFPTLSPATSHQLQTGTSHPL